MSFETQINSIIKDAKNKGLNFKEIVTENGLKDMIDFNKELEYDNLADTFIEVFKKKTGMCNENNLKDDFDDCDENFYVEFTSPDFRFLKKLKNTICYILRKHESKAS